MAIDTSGNLLGHLRDQRYVGGDNSVGNLLTGFLSTYLAAKDAKDAETKEFNEQTSEGVQGHNLAMQMLGQGGMIPSDMVEQVQLSPVESRTTYLQRLGNAMLGNQREMQDLVLKQKTAQLEGQQLINRERSGYLDDTRLMQDKLSQLRQGIDVDASGLQSPKSVQDFEASKNKYVADQRIVKDGNDLNALLNGISGDAWSKPETFDSLVRFKAQHPFLNAGQNKAIADAIGHVRKNIEDTSGEVGEGEFREDPITGQRFLIRGKSTLRSGTNPAFAPSKFDTLDYASLLRRQEQLEKDIRKGTNAMGVPFSPNEMRILREQREAIESQLKSKRPGQKSITPPNMTIDNQQPSPEELTPAATQDAQKLISEANEAIKNGAPKDKVYERLREMGLEVGE